MQKWIKDTEDKKIEKLFKPNMERSTSTYHHQKKREANFFDRLNKKSPK